MRPPLGAPGGSASASAAASRSRQSPGEVVTRLLMRREQVDPSQEGTGSERSGVSAGEWVAGAPRRRGPVSQPCALPSAARQRPTLRPDSVQTIRKLTTALSRGYVWVGGRIWELCLPGPSQPPSAAHLLARGLRVALFLALTCERGQCPQPPGCPPPYGRACSRL